MRIIFLLFLLPMFTNCNDAGSNIQKTSSREPADTSRLVEVLSFNGIKNTSLLIHNDSAFFVIPDALDHPKYYSLRKFFYTPADGKFHFKMDSALKPAAAINDLLNSTDLAVKINSIGNPKIEYAQLSNTLKNETSIKKILSPEKKIQQYGNEYFFINKLSPKALYQYDPSTKKLLTFDIKEELTEITDFFLFDMDKDNNPEIFIFHIGSVPRNDVVSYSVYSIRKG